MQPLWIDLLALAAGLALLVAGGDLLVRGAVAIANRLALPPLVIGLTLVGFGTSAPELVASLQAAVAGSPEIAVGNVVGSNIANILLILGLAAVVSPLAAAPEALHRDGTVMLAATVVCVLIALSGSADRWTGGLLIVLLAAYLAYTFWRERNVDDPSALMHEHESAVVSQPSPQRLSIALGLCVAGLVLLVLGARVLVGGAVALAATAGVSETVIGLSVVAVGTSLPELVTSLVAAIRREGDIAFGNVIGSNIFNVLGILGVTALVQPLQIPHQIINVDIWVMLGASVLLVVFAATGGRLTRLEGVVFLAGYTLYIAHLVVG